jgi:lysophospholipase L1-like esterase
MYRSDGAILRTYAQILQCCKDQSPHTRVFVQSIFPRHPMYAARIKRLNARLRALAGANGYVFIDVFPLLADYRGALRADLTNDNLHLMAGGYAIWVQALQPFVSAQ